MRLHYQKLLLVNPGKDKIFSSNEPLNLAYLASFLENQGVEVEIADQLSGENVVDKANRFNPDIVGITATSTMIEDAYDIAAYFKDRKIPTVLGGVHVSSVIENNLSAVDMVVKGEGEYSLLEILSSGAEKGIFANERIVDIDKAPLPARHLLNMEYYLNVRKKFPQDGNYIFIPRRERMVSVLITRGCPWNCAFCHNIWRGLPFRIYSPAKVVEELSRLQSKYRIRYCLFRDDNIYAQRSRIREIMLALIDAGLGMRWGASARVDCLDDELLELSKRAGCEKLNFGFESGSQRLLDDLQKGTTVAKAYEAVNLCRKHGIKVSGTFIAGHPREEKWDVIQTRKMIRRLKLDSLGVAIATPFPGTKWWQLAKEKELIPDRVEWKKFDFDNIPIKLNQNFSAKELKNIQKTYWFDAFLANPKYLLQIIAAVIAKPTILIKRIRSVLWLK